MRQVFLLIVVITLTPTRFIFLLAAACLAVPVVIPSSLICVYISFVIFEFCVGIFWPAVTWLFLNNTSFDCRWVQCEADLFQKHPVQQ